MLVPVVGRRGPAGAVLEMGPAAGEGSGMMLGVISPIYWSHTTEDTTLTSLEDNDDVQDVYANFDISEEDMAAAMEG